MKGNSDEGKLCVKGREEETDVCGGKGRREGIYVRGRRGNQN